MVRAAALIIALAFVGNAAAAAPPAKPRPPAKGQAAPVKKKAATHAIPTTGALSDVDLMSIGRLGLLDLIDSPDPFQVPLAAKFSGRQFSFEQRFLPKDSNNAEEVGRWDYDIVGEELTLTLAGDAELPIFYNETPSGSYIGSNAFGVKLRVQRRSAIEVKLAYDSAPPHTTYGFVQSVRVGPGEAKRLAGAARVRVEGVITGRGKTSPVKCEATEDGATIDDPVELSTTSCVISAAITRVTFVDAGTGATLVDWPTAEPVVRPSAIANPTWLRQPTMAEIDRFYPERAQREERNGSATIRCAAQDSGDLAGCSLVSESPAGFGFGDAALKMSSLYKMKAVTDAGAPVGGASVTVSVAFTHR